MIRKIFFNDQKIEYKLRKSRRAKRMRIAVYGDTNVVVTLPYGLKENLVEKFLRVKAAWLLDKIFYFKKYGKPAFIKGSKIEYQKNKQAALNLAAARINYFNKIYKLKFNKIAIKRQKTRWGSCSSRGNLNYNYKILFLPDYLADYIIVHELCHLQEFNHSRKFWNLVAQVVPNYSEIKRELKTKH